MEGGEGRIEFSLCVALRIGEGEELCDYGISRYW